MILATEKTMKEMDQKTIKTFGVPGVLLMEKAALEVMKVMDALEPFDRIIVVCGTGNNGGDGFAVARNCLQNGHDVMVILVGEPTSIKGDAKVMYDAVVAHGICVNMVEDYLMDEPVILSPSKTLIVDALFGISCHRPLEGYYEKIVHWMNDSGKPILSIDMPSGVICDSGQLAKVAVKASITVTFTLPKIGLYLRPGKYQAGTVVVKPIGIPQVVLESFTFDHELIDGTILNHLPKRKVDSHKYTYGRILLVAGSETMIGAAMLSAMAAYRSGAGLVEILTHEKGVDALMCQLPEAIVHRYNEQSLDEVLRGIERRQDSFDSVLVGPGIGLGQTGMKLLKQMLKIKACPVVMDADALTMVSYDEIYEIIGDGKRIMTPHLGELSRLSGYEVGFIKDHLLQVCHEVSQKYQCVLVAKSDCTLVVNPDGQVCINGLGNPGMATAGSGDVLSGVITSLAGQKMDLYKSAVVGVGLHSLAGDWSAIEHGEASLMARDMIQSIHKIMVKQEERES